MDTLGESYTWTDMGPSQSSPYTGTFLGNGYTIKNLTTMTESETLTKMFYFIGEGSVIDNIHFENSNFSGIVHYNYGIVSNCSVNECTIEYEVTSGGSNTSLYLGAFVGSNTSSGQITKCSVTECSITSTVTCRYRGVGGICGWGTGLIDDCHVISCTITSTGHVGGILGYVNSGLTLTNCSVEETQIYAGSSYAGLIVGYDNTSSGQGVSYSGNTVSNSRVVTGLTINTIGY